MVFLLLVNGWLRRQHGVGEHGLVRAQGEQADDAGIFRVQYKYRVGKHRVGESAVPAQVQLFPGKIDGLFNFIACHR